jgi:hypothetical protein
MTSRLIERSRDPARYNPAPRMRALGEAKMRLLHQTAAMRFVSRTLAVLVAAIAITAVLHDHISDVAVAQTGKTSAPIPMADEYYAVKTDWIRSDRSILTIKHGPSGSCYILLYPSGETLMPVETDRCASAAVEK